MSEFKSKTIFMLSTSDDIRSSVGSTAISAFSKMTYKCTKLGQGTLDFGL